MSDADKEQTKSKGLIALQEYNEKVKSGEIERTAPKTPLQKWEEDKMSFKTEKGVRVKLEDFLTLLECKGSPVEYVSGFKSYTRTKSLFKCRLHGSFKSIPRLVIKNNNHGCKGCIKTNRKNLACGVGVNDATDYNIEDYYLWYNVIRRSNMKTDCYGNVSCHADWLRLSVFLNDLPNIDNYKMRDSSGWVIDKDLLSGENKIYSKDTTCFLPDEINNSLAIGGKSRKTRGAIFDREIGKYFALVMLDGKRRRFGSFETKEEAHEKYKEEKLSEIKRLAEKYKEDLTERCYQALLGWQHF